MNKESGSINKASSLDDVDAQFAIEWLSANKKNILIGFIILFVLLIFSYRILAQRTVNAESDYVSAQIIFNHIQESAPSGELLQDQLTELSAIIHRHPELGAKYDAPLAEMLLIEGQAAQAAPYAKSVFARTKADDLAFYRSFGETSLLIAAGDHQKAYEKAKELKQQLDQDTSHRYGAVLYGYNLIRLASLEQALGLTEEENKTWDELKSFSNAEIDFSDAIKVYSDGKASLSGYVESRQI